MLNPGSGFPIRVEVRALDGVRPNDTMALTIVQRSTNDPSKLDVVKATTTCAPTYVPDLLIRKTGDTDYVGDHVYNKTGASQTVTQVTPVGAPVFYDIELQNDGNIADTITVTGTRGSNGWQVMYSDESSADITAAMTDANGWTSPSLDPGGVYHLHLAVTPLAGATAGRTLWVKAKSVGDPTKQDWVAAISSLFSSQGFRSAWIAAHGSQPQVDPAYDLDKDGLITWTDAEAFVELLLQEEQEP